MEYNYRQVVRMASYNPAKLIGLDKDYGSISVGKLASMIAVEPGGDVVMTMVEGKIVYQKG